MSYTNPNQVLETLLMFSCLLCLRDKITRDVNSGLLTEMILIDLQKAFHTIDHNILIKNNFLVLTGQINKCCTSYLSN